ncbi:MAG: division/cell wall cluster transcriptional repressor MraZ [Myxococcota bacterium]
MVDQLKGAGVFKGQYEHQLDTKGRVALPAAFRRGLAEQGDEQLVIAPHIQSDCLVAYPDSYWREFEAKVARLSQFDTTATNLRRLVLGRAQDCPVDKVGRVLLPSAHRKAAHIDAQVIWMGVGSYIEVWEPSRLVPVAPMETKVSVDDATLEKLAELGL